MNYSTIDDAVKRLKAGGLIIVSDNTARENEGDLIGLGSTIDHEGINFIITHARGQLCAPVSSEIANKLGLKPIVANNTEVNKTAFYTPLDGSNEATGVTTGVSAFDRATTINHLANPDMKKGDFVHPGHVFPLVAKDGGVLERDGHTEASIDLAKLAGEPKVAAICEIIMPDGHMARRDYLELMSIKYNLPFITIDQLKDHMAKH